MIRPLLSLALLASLTACQTDAPDADALTPEATTAEASGAATGPVSVSDPFVTAAPAGGTGGVFMTLIGGADSDTLVDARSAVAERVEVHETYDAGDGMRGMRQVENGIPVPSGETVDLAPGGYHVMLLGLADEIAVGDTLDIEAVFARAGAVQVRVPVVTLDRVREAM